MRNEEARTPLLADVDPNDVESGTDVGKRSVQGHGSSTANYEEALLSTGFGKFNLLLVAVCGWAQISDSVEILSVSFLLPVAEQSLNLSDFDKGLLNSIIFVGMMVGSYVWGALADIQGRKGVLVYSMACNALFGFASSFAQSFWLFLLCRFGSGVGVGGALPVVFSYFGEFQHKNHRGAMISVLSTCWMFGNILTAGIAWLVIPSDLGYKPKKPTDFSYESWRVFIAICILPALTSVVSFVLLPESPKFLLEKGKEKEALKILQDVFKMNKKNATREEYPVKHLIPTTKEKRGTLSSPSESVAFIDKASSILNSTFQLFRVPLLGITLNILAIFFSLSFGYYGLWMWFPQIFAQVEYGNGSACSPPVKIDTNDSAIYKDAFLTAISNLPGNLFTIFFMDRLGRKPLMGISLVLSGISVFFIWFVTSRTTVLLTSMCFGGASVIAWNTLNVLGVELYPTPLRSTALGVQSVVNRIGAITGNLMFGVLIGLDCSVPLLTVAALLGLGGIFTVFLPNTTKVALQ